MAEEPQSPLLPYELELSKTPAISPRPPFDDEDADIVLRSADGVEFRLYKVVLNKASSLFRDMLASRSPDGGGSDTNFPSISLTEDADTLEGLLRFCYPVARPSFTTVDQLGLVLVAAKKYGMPAAWTELLCSLESLMVRAESPPIRAYTLACLCELPDIARAAAKLLLNDDRFLEAEPMPPEFSVLPCEVMYTFAVYRRKCIGAALAIVDDTDWLLSGNHNHRMAYSNKGNPHLDSTWVWLACSQCAAGDQVGIWAGRRSGERMLYPRAWWVSYSARVRRTLAQRPLGKIAVEPSYMERALDQAATCSHCATRARKELTEYSQLMMKRIDAALDQIQFDLPFRT